jgi:glycine/serine hydroxymethyltransferase
MDTIAALIDEALMNTENTEVLNSVKNRVHALMAKYPLYA